MITNPQEMAERVQDLFTICHGFYLRQINFILERATDRPNPDFGWLTVPLEYTLLNRKYTFVGFDFQPTPTRPSVLIIESKVPIVLRGPKIKPYRFPVDDLPVEVLRALRNQLLLTDNLTTTIDPNKYRFKL